MYILYLYDREITIFSLGVKFNKSYSVYISISLFANFQRNLFQVQFISDEIYCL